MEELPSDRDPVAEERYADETAEDDPAADDPDHLFGIDLGPAGDRRDSEQADEDAPAPERPPSKTLTERLATAAADRESADEPPDEDASD